MYESIVLSTSFVYLAIISFGVFALVEIFTALASEGTRQYTVVMASLPASIASKPPLLSKLRNFISPVLKFSPSRENSNPASPVSRKVTIGMSRFASPTFLHLTVNENVRPVRAPLGKVVSVSRIGPFEV